MKKFAWILPVAAGILWGSVGVFVRTLSDYGMNSFTVVESRVSMAVLLLLIGIGIYDRKQLKVRPKDLWLFILTGTLGMLGLNITYNEAINHLPLSLAAVLLSLSPVFVLMLAAVFFKEKITARKTGCALLAILGCTLASGVLESLTGMEISGTGLVLGVASGLFYALYSIFTKAAMRRGYSGLTITFLLHGGSGDLSAPFQRLGTDRFFLCRSACGKYILFHSSCFMRFCTSLCFIHGCYTVYGRRKGVYPGGRRTGGGYGFWDAVFFRNSYACRVCGNGADSSGYYFAWNAGKEEKREKNSFFYRNGQRVKSF